MFLSIIIPIYKVEPYLRECLDSVAASPLDCWEAILVDDGSPDGCPQICDEYAGRDRRFRVIHQENGGVAAARNAGLDVAQGEWVWFVDADDLVDMRYVEDMMLWLQSHEGADMAMFDLETFKDDTQGYERLRVGERSSGMTLKLRNTSLRNGAPRPMVVAEMADLEEFMECYDCSHHQRLWYRRETLRDLRFSVDIRVGEDLEFQYKFLTLCHRPFKFDMTLYYDRLRETTATDDVAYRRKEVEDLPVVLHNLAAWCKEHHVEPERWLDYRIRKLFQNYLHSASTLNTNPSTLNTNLQKEVRSIVSEYRALKFPFVWNPKILFSLFTLYL